MQSASMIKLWRRRWLGVAACICLVLYVLAFHRTLIIRPRKPRPIITQLRSIIVDYDPLEHCVTPFGTLLGIANMTPAFSNCNTRFESKHISYVSLSDPMDLRDFDDDRLSQHFMTTYRHRSTEFATRWLAANRGLMMVLTEAPKDLWLQTGFFNPLASQRRYDAEYIDDGSVATTLEERKFFAPRRADLIVYDASTGALTLPHGHVAVITHVEDAPDLVDNATLYVQLRKERLQPRRLYLAEQNLRNEDWGGRNYSRVALFQWTRKASGAESKAKMSIIDPDGLRVKGLVRIGRLNEEPAQPNEYEKGLNTEYEPEPQDEL